MVFRTLPFAVLLALAGTGGGACLQDASDRRLQAAVQESRWSEVVRIFSTVRKPTYQDFYEKGDVDVHYWLSALLVGELLGNAKSGPAVIPRILDELARSGDHEASVRSVTGQDPRNEFERLTRRLWTSRP